MLFALTSIRMIPKDEPSIYNEKSKDALRLSCRTVAIFDNKELVLEAIRDNWGDLNEAGWYPWLAVEELNPNTIYPINFPDNNRLFFKWDNEIEKWIECGYPKKIKDFFVGNKDYYGENYLWQHFATIG